MNGCGGSSSGTGAGLVSEGAVYVATLSGGGEMVLQLLQSDGKDWSGEFETIPGDTSAPVEGMFAGTISGNKVQLNCTSEDGTSFTLSGTLGSDHKLVLDHSDLAGPDLQFEPKATTTPSVRSNVTFQASLNRNSIPNNSSGTATVSSTPYYSDSSIQLYTGTWGTWSLEAHVYTSSKSVYLVYYTSDVEVRQYYRDVTLSDLGTKKFVSYDVKVYLRKNNQSWAFVSQDGFTAP